MALGEFELIRRYFSRPAIDEPGVVLGIGDDAALLAVRPGEELVVCTDSLVSGVHFPADTAPTDLATRALCVNLSDLAAMGADARWYTLALTLPTSEEFWLAEFSAGLVELSRRYGVTLVGGDTTRGPLTITVTALGTVPVGQALRRDGAQVGDALYVTGHLGEGAAALALLQGTLACESADEARLYRHFHQPVPRLTEGRLLRGLATSAIDISDGLLADAGHIATASDVCMRIDLECLPTIVRGEINNDLRLQWALTGGDDYELCFTVAPERERHLRALIEAGELMATRVGCVSAGSGVACYDRGRFWTPPWPAPGYQHF